jgi:hypothetical protein
MVHPVFANMSCDSPVSIVTDYELDGREFGVQFLAETKHLPLPHRVKIGSEVNLAIQDHLMLTLRIREVIPPLPHSPSWFGA